MLRRDENHNDESNILFDKHRCLNHPNPAPAPASNKATSGMDFTQSWMNIHSFFSSRSRRDGNRWSVAIRSAGESRLTRVVY